MIKTNLIRGGDVMRFLGLVLIPLLVILVFTGPACQRSQEEPKVEIEQAVDEVADAPMMEKAPAAIEEAQVPAMEEVEEAVEEVEAEAQKEGSGLLKQLQEKAEEEGEKKAEEYEVEKKLDELDM